LFIPFRYVDQFIRNGISAGHVRAHDDPAIFGLFNDRAAPAYFTIVNGVVWVYFDSHKRPLKTASGLYTNITLKTDLSVAFAIKNIIICKDLLRVR
jgi:hypothetical protein